MPDDPVSPISIVREAIKAVPAVKWALGVGGILAVVALAYSFRIEPANAFVSLIAMFAFMGILVIFARASALENRAIAWPAMVFTWFVLLMFMAVSAMLFTSVFFYKPLELHWLTGPSKAEPSPTPAPPSPEPKPTPPPVPPRPIAERIFGPSMHSHAGDNPADGPPVTSCATADVANGWHLKPNSGNPETVSVVNGDMAVTAQTYNADSYCITFHMRRADKGHSAEVVGRAAATQERTCNDLKWDEKLQCERNQ